LTPYFNTTYTHGLSCGITAGKWLYSNNEFIVLDNGINVDKFKFNKNIRYAKREELGIKEEDIIIGSVGFLDTNKNQEYLIDLVNEFEQYCKQKYKLMLIGDGPLKEKIIQKAKNYGLDNNLLILGRREDIPDLMFVMDIFILPSHSEGFPMTL